MKTQDIIISEEKVRLDPKCWTGKKIGNPKTKMKGGVRVNNCVPAESMAEDDAGDVEQRTIAKIAKYKEHLAHLKKTDPEAYKREIAKSKTSSRVPPVSTFEGVAEGKEELHTQLQSINQKLKLMRGGPVGEPNSMAFVKKRKELLKQKEQILSQLKQGVAEEWSKKYKDSINCSNPKGFSQKAHCAGKAKNEDYNPEYDDEAGMAQGSLHTLKNAVEGLSEIIDSGDNLPEWCQEKISLAEDYLVTVWDYIQSEKAQGIDPEIEEMYEAMDELAEEMAQKKGVSADLVWETFESMDDNMLYETAAWRRKEGKSKTGGLNAKGVASYRRENPGSKLQTAVTTKPSKLKKGSKAAKRRKSFCARMSGVKGPMKKPNGKPTRKALALRKWNC